jgi:hypothetical protein
MKRSPSKRGSRLTRAVERDAVEAVDLVDAS